VSRLGVGSSYHLTSTLSTHLPKLLHAGAHERLGVVAPKHAGGCCCRRACNHEAASNQRPAGAEQAERAAGRGQWLLLAVLLVAMLLVVEAAAVVVRQGRQRLQRGVARQAMLGCSRRGASVAAGGRG
jgi:hypothetical protein